MKKLNKHLKQIWSSQSLAHDERGLSTVEYVIILVLIAVIGIVSWNKFGTAVRDKVDDAKSDIEKLGGKT